MRKRKRQEQVYIVVDCASSSAAFLGGEEEVWNHIDGVFSRRNEDLPPGEHFALEDLQVLVVEIEGRGVNVNQLTALLARVSGEQTEPASGGDANSYNEEEVMTNVRRRLGLDGGNPHGVDSAVG